MSTHEILCGKCGTPVSGAEEPNLEDRITCSKCGRSDTYAEVVESAKAFVTDEALKHLGAKMGDVFKGSKSIKYTSGELPRTKHRWTVAGFRL